MKDLLDPRKTTDNEFLTMFWRACLVMLLVFCAIALWILVPLWWLSDVWYRFWVAAWPVILGGG